MSTGETLKPIWDTGLSDKEYMVIGDIVAQWGALEAEIFIQTLESFDSDIQVSELPRAMRNRNFSEVLGLWKERVVDVAEDAVNRVFNEAYEKILKLKDVRHSIVHGMWDFSVSESKTISTFRVKNDQIIHTTFKDGALVDVCMQIAEINASIRYPSGMVEFFNGQMSGGVYVNHAAMRRMKLKLEHEQDGNAQPIGQVGLSPDVPPPDGPLPRMNTIQIREFRDGDEADLHKIFYSAVHEVASADYTPEQVDAWAPANMDLEAWYSRVRKNRPFVAVMDGSIVGFADLQEDGHIDQFFVAASYSRCGIGGALMKHIDQVALKKGLSQLTSDVSRTAEPFFRRFGFDVVERRLPMRHGVAIPNAFMRKYLGADSSLNCDGSTAATR